MHPQRRHHETHRTERIGWLRAAVLGANDGIVSTASLLLGVAAAGGGQREILMTGVAGLVGGAMSMAAGEYVSVHSQADTEKADLAREREELSTDPAGEQRELAGIYVQRGLTQALADQVAAQLTAHDALAAHGRDELGLMEHLVAKPVQAALASAASFAVGAALPLGVAALPLGFAAVGLGFAALPLGFAVLSGPAVLMVSVALTSLAFLAMLGIAAASAGGASLWTGAVRVTFWGGIAMGVTAGAGRLFGVVAG